jgi:uncharacterized protein (TIGR02246 family)
MSRRFLRGKSLFLLGLAAILAALPLAAQEGTSKSDSSAPAAEEKKTPEQAAPKDDSSADLSAIRAAGLAFVEAFNKHDAKAVADHWTDSGEYVGEDGASLSGRPAIEKAYAAFFADNPEAKIRVVVDDLRLLSDDAAIEDGRTMVEPPPAGAPAIGKYTAVHVKRDGKWLMATVRDTRVETPSAYRNVADLEFLIGTWTAEEHGAKNRSVCRWVANKSFVERRYATTAADGTTISGVQLIGWNPQGGHVESWNFSSDGGHAVGVWSPIEDGWQAEVTGVTGDGTPTAAVNVLRRLDDDAYVWQSIDRTAAGMPLPDTGEIVLKRSQDGG